MPQPPQFCVSFETFVSHFLPSLGTHSAFGNEQSLTPHVESEHAAVPTLEVQTLPQPPQFPTLTVMSVSQPSARPLTQSAWFVSHLMLHALVAGSHVALPPFAEQWLSQLPHVSGALRFASQPFLASPSQSTKPAVHVTLQTPSVQTPLPFAGMHLWPQAPQSPGAESVSASQPFDGSPSQSA